MRQPLSGGLWGIALGLAIGIILQQQGVWPPDKITIALVPGALGAIGIIITSVGRSGGTTALTVAIVIVAPLTAYGATGLGEIGETGQLNGGCTAKATSAVDSINSPVDTSRGDPFVIDPERGLSWEATSGGSVFDDYPWEIWVEVAGVAIPIDGEESENNDEGDTENSGDVSNVQEYGESKGLPVSQLRGVFMVGGFASICDGFGFVTLQAGLFETIISQIALALAVLALVMLIRAYLRSRPQGPVPANGPSGGNGFDRGDMDGDGNIDLDDMTPLDGNGPTTPPLSGDADGDGDVDFDDFPTAIGDDGGTGHEPGAEDLPNPEDHA